MSELARCDRRRGWAGRLVSTLELLRSGHTVLLLDRCEPKEIGGLAREAFGGMFMVDSPEQRRSRIPDNERAGARGLAADRRVRPRGHLASTLGRAVRDAGARRCRRLAARARREVLSGRQLGRARQLRRRQLGAALPFDMGNRQGACASRMERDRGPSAPLRARSASALPSHWADVEEGRAVGCRVTAEHTASRARGGVPRTGAQHSGATSRGTWARTSRTTPTIRGPCRQGCCDRRRRDRRQPRSGPPRMAHRATRGRRRRSC